MPHSAPSVVRGDRRQHVLGHADALFQQHGFASPTLSDVALTAQITTLELELLFSSKDVLLEAVIDSRHGRFIGRVQDCCDSVDAAHDKVLSIFLFLEEWFADGPLSTDVFTSAYVELGQDQPWVTEMARRHVTVFTTLVEDLAVAAGLPRPLGTSIAVLAEGAQVTAALTGSVTPITEARTAAAMLIAVYQADLDIADF